jgi:SET domain-containing protein
MGDQTIDVDVVQNCKIGLEVTPEKGRGVYAVADIRRGEVVEHCPAIPLPLEQWSVVETTLLGRYLLPFEHETYGSTYAAVGGYAMFYNHDDDPNAEWHDEEWADGNPMISIVATRDIAAGESITVDYGGGQKVVFDPDGDFDVLDEERA